MGSRAIGGADDGSRRGTVLIACRQGASRSASVMCAHLMTAHHLSVLDAFQRIASRRWCVWPNAGFVEQLCVWQDELTRLADGRPSAVLDVSPSAVTMRRIGVHAAWAANRHNVERGGGFGRAGLTLSEVDALWDQASAAL